jgi:hypothetical protein
MITIENRKTIHLTDDPIPTDVVMFLVKSSRRAVRSTPTQIYRIIHGGRIDIGAHYQQRYTVYGVIMSFNAPAIYERIKRKFARWLITGMKTKYRLLPSMVDRVIDEYASAADHPLRQWKIPLPIGMACRAGAVRTQKDTLCISKYYRIHSFSIMPGQRHKVCNRYYIISPEWQAKQWIIHTLDQYATAPPISRHRRPIQRIKPLYLSYLVAVKQQILLDSFILILRRYLMTNELVRANVMITGVRLNGYDIHRARRRDKKEHNNQYHTSGSGQFAWNPPI